MTLYCDTNRRRSVVRGHADLNGLDYVEVSEDQRRITVRLLKPVTAASIGPESIRIAGGARIRSVPVQRVEPEAGEMTRVFAVIVEQPGDFSVYTLRIVDPAHPPDPPAGFDPLLSTIDFSFKVDCPSNADCLPADRCVTPLPADPELNYLAKDYHSFLRLMFDRMAATLPSWRERDPADVGVALVELLAFVGDQLSYRQDAVATEAHLGTARLRTSVRRHARLVDYRMHDGSNARAWVQLSTSVDGVRVRDGTTLLTQVSGVPTRLSDPSDDLRRALAAAPLHFLTMGEAVLYRGHDLLTFYTWGGERCCIPAGSTAATLAGAHPHLRPGMVLILAERRGLSTGLEQDADPGRRHAVRLVEAQITEDPVGGGFEDPPVSDLRPVTNIRWHADDALPFALTVAARIRDVEYGDIAVAHGNIVLADHGAWTPIEEIAGPGPDPGGVLRLTAAPITMAAPAPDSTAPAADAFAFQPRHATAALALESLEVGGSLGWEIHPDLLNSGPDHPHAVVEVDEGGAAALRFGDGVNGRRPTPGAPFRVAHRVGNGTAGNIPAGALKHVVSNDDGVVGVTNLLPGRGGAEAETIETVRRNAPVAFRVQRRAVTPEDYARVVGTHPGVQRAAAVFRWTGSWYTVYLAVDRRDGRPLDAEFRESVVRLLESYRMAGHDVEIDEPRWAPIRLDMTICVEPGYARGDVRRAIDATFHAGRLADGRPALFHPDRFSFSSAIPLSPFVAAAQEIEGVAFVRVRRFEFLHRRSQGIVVQELRTGPYEIARLDRDPNYPDRGVFAVSVEGGR